MALTDIERHRAKPLEPATMDKLARDYRTLSARSTRCSPKFRR